MTESLSSFQRKLNALERELTGPKLKQHMKAIGEAAKEIAEAEASRDLGGDPKFSGWAPELETRYVHVDDGVISFRPTKRSAGPWTVANDGRNQGTASGFFGPGANRLTGQTARTKTGNVRKVRAFKARRWNGTTRGKGTADRAQARIDKQVDRMNRDFVRNATKPLT